MSELPKATGTVTSAPAFFGAFFGVLGLARLARPGRAPASARLAPGLGRRPSGPGWSAHRPASCALLWPGALSFAPPPTRIQVASTGPGQVTFCRSPSQLQATVLAGCLYAIRWGSPRPAPSFDECYGAYAGRGPRAGGSGCWLSGYLSVGLLRVPRGGPGQSDSASMDDLESELAGPGSGVCRH